jgi:hypothetical protein
LAGIGKLILKFLGNFKGPRIATVLKKSWELTISDDKTDSHCAHWDSSQYWQTDWHIQGPKSRTVNPEINPHVYCQMILNKCSKTLQWDKSSFFLSGWHRDKWISTCKRMSSCPSRNTKIQ